MKKLAIVSSLLLTAALNITPVHADNVKTSTEKDIGFLSGAITGAIIGGPVGFFVGGVSGAMMGQEVAKANQLDGVKSELTLQQDKNDIIHQELTSIKQDNSRMGHQLASTSQWLTQGLTINLMFTTNSSELSKNDLQMISRVSSILNQYPELKIRLDGYTDPRGTKGENMLLSKERTQAVSDAFANNGVMGHQLVAQSHGESNLGSQAGNADEYALERRVSVNFVTSKAVSVAQN